MNKTSNASHTVWHAPPNELVSERTLLILSDSISKNIKNFEIKKNTWFNLRNLIFYIYLYFTDLLWIILEKSSRQNLFEYSGIRIKIKSTRQLIDAWSITTYDPAMMRSKFISREEAGSIGCFDREHQ